MHSRPRNVGALAACQALLVTNNITVISIGSLAGYALAPVKAWSTFPATAYIAGAALSTYPLSLLMKRHGRRFGFTLGALSGVGGAMICTLALWQHLFWLFCLGTFIAGAYNASGGYYRFAAADAAPAGSKNRAISLVLAGGMVGGILGPESSKITRELLSTAFLGSYAALIVFALIAIVILRWIDLPTPTDHERQGTARPLSEIMRQPVFIVAASGAVTAYAVMNLLMGATPLAMQMCGLPYGAATLVIQWHIVGMFAPALIAGSLVQRFGAPSVMTAGAVTFAACLGAALSGQTTVHFWLSGTLLGVGWCFMYVGGTSLLTESYRPSEKAKAQGINDLLVFVVMGTSSAISGSILWHYGWNWLNLAALPWLTITVCAVAWLGMTRRAARRAAVAAGSIDA